MGFDLGYVIGLFLCWGASIFGALGNVLFKYHNTLRIEDPTYPKDGWSYWYLAVAMIFTGSIASVVSFALIPLSINCVHAALPIFLGEVFSCKMLNNQLDTAQWLLIVLILLAVTGVVAWGDHETNDDVTDEIEDHFWNVESVIFVGFNVIAALCAFLIIKLQPIPDPVLPCSLFNISGPVLTAAIGNCTQVSARVCMTIVKCAISDCEDVNIGTAWYAMFGVLPVFAVCQLIGVSFTMGKLHLVTVIPIYGTLLIVLPSLSGCLIMHEVPSNTTWYAFSMCMIVVFNVIFVSITQQKKSEQEMDEPLIVDSISVPPVHTSYASILSKEVTENSKEQFEADKVSCKSNLFGRSGDEVEDANWKHFQGSIQSNTPSKSAAPASL